MHTGKNDPQAAKLRINQPIPLPSAKAKRLRQLEAQSIHIFREVVAEFEKPVLLYSIGKDSSVLLHLAMKAFAPGPLPFPLLHVDTTWKFKDMYRFRDRTADRYGLNLIIHINQDGIKRGINPFASGSTVHTHIMKTEALKQALDIYGFNAAFGGARRDEEKSRAKERVLSFRAPGHVWDPRQQRPELWSLFNTKISKGESVRAFPLSDWTEMDVWHYIRAENIDVVPLYFSAPRPVVWRSGTWIMVDDDRIPLLPDEQIVERQIRFRTLGCWPLSGAIESDACSIDEIIDEMYSAGTSERQGRLIDSDESASMERKKKEGYF
jgi:sulfate adenylyltransferase subunit 2